MKALARYIDAEIDLKKCVFGAVQQEAPLIHGDTNVLRIKLIGEDADPNTGIALRFINPRTRDSYGQYSGTLEDGMEIDVPGNEGLFSAGDFILEFSAELDECRKSSVCTARIAAMLCPRGNEYAGETEVALFSDVLAAGEAAEAAAERVAQAIEDGAITGEDGFSPTVEISSITGGHRVAVTDKTGTESFDVMDGANGTTPVKGTDYFTAAEIAQVVSAAAAEVDVPTSVSELTNDTGYISVNDDVEMVPMMLSGTTVTVNMNLMTVYGLFNSAKKTYFLMPLSEYGGIVFEPAEVDLAAQRIKLSAIDSGTLYQIALTPNGDTMTGTLSQKSLPDVPSWALQSAKPTYTASEVDALPSSTKYAGADVQGGAAKKTLSIPFGAVDSTSTSTAYTATIDGITELRDGVCVMLKNGVATSAAGCTLNVNNLGAKPIYQTMAEATSVTTTFNVNYTMLFVYNSTRVSGACWDMFYGYNANTTYSNASLGQGYATCSTAAATTAKTAALSSYALTAGGYVAVKFTYDVPANATLNVNSKGAKAIYYKGAAITSGVIKAGDVAVFIYSTYYHLVGIDRWGTDISSLGSSVDGHTSAINSLTSTVEGHTTDITDINLKLQYDNLVMTLSDGVLTLDTVVGVQAFMQTFALGYNFLFLLPVAYLTGEQTTDAISFQITSVDTTTATVTLSAIYDGKAYYASLSPVSQTALSGALHIVPLSSGGGGGGGGGESSETLLGQTPVELTSSASALILVSDGECSYTVQSPTVKDFDILNGSPTSATISQEDNHFVLQAGSAANWYQSYIETTVTGLTVNEDYNFVFDSQGFTFSGQDHTTPGHYILYDADNNTLATKNASDVFGLYSYPFTATTTSVKLRWYPSANTYYAANVSKAYVNRIYINRAGKTAHTEVIDMSGTFTGSTTLRAVPAGVTVSSSPSCYVYSRASSGDGTGGKPLAGKTIVCFGDSLFGMYRGDTSAPAFVAETTGANVYNVGFGGCRMATHPTTGYAAFSMWALADAVATGTWTAQDAQASSGSSYFPDQLAILKGIDFSKVDYAVIHYGTNDFGGSVAIGSSSPASDHSTLCGALRYSIEALLTAYPKLRIFISLPVYRFWTENNVTTYAETYQNSQNKTLPDYIEAMKDVAKEYNLPVIDGYGGMGINRINAAQFLSDGTHHNETGRRRFGAFIGARIAANM